MLATAHAERISGNLEFIRRELAARYPGLPVTVFAFRQSTSRGGRIGAAIKALRSGFLLATSRVVVVDDYFFPIYAVTPRPGTVRAQVWHACGAFKKFGYSVVEKEFGADEDLLKHVRIHSNYDIVLVSSRSVAPHYAEAFDQPLELFRSDLGIPRTDVFFGEERIAATAASVRARYAIPADRRVVLYAPTFRGATIGQAAHPAHLDLPRMHEALGDDHVVLVRLHPFVRAAAPIPPELAGFAIDVSDHPEFNELLLVTDVLVTDYSSAIFEFALLGRPMAFLAPDHAAYERERGFYFDYASGVPGPVFETTDALAGWLRSGVVDLDRVARFRQASFDVADGGATARFVDRVVVPGLRDGSIARPS